MTGILPRRVLPVLMYHRIGEPDGGDPALTVSPSTFERHLEWIEAAGCRTLSLEEAYDCVRSWNALRRAVLLTIDDGFDETLANAAPRLAARAMRAAVFVPAGLLGREAELAPSYGGSGVAAPARGRVASVEGLEAWLAAGNEVGSHSLTHADLTLLDESASVREAGESRVLLERALGRPILDFCYPYAHHSAASREIVRQAGYRAAYAGEPPTRDLFAVPRMMVYPDDSRARFERKLSGRYYWYSAWHRRLRSGFGLWRDTAG